MGGCVRLRFSACASALIETNFIRNLIRSVSKFRAPLFAFSISRGVRLGGAHYSWRERKTHAKSKIKKTLAWFGARQELNKKEEEEVTAA